jgi:hypothetical protein
MSVLMHPWALDWPRNKCDNNLLYIGGGFFTEWQLDACFMGRQAFWQIPQLEGGKSNYWESIALISSKEMKTKNLSVLVQARSGLWFEILWNILQSIYSSTHCFCIDQWDTVHLELQQDRLGDRNWTAKSVQLELQIQTLWSRLVHILSLQILWTAFVLSPILCLNDHVVFFVFRMWNGWKALPNCPLFSRGFSMVKMVSTVAASLACCQLQLLLFCKFYLCMVV